MSSFKSNENIHKKEDGPYYVVCNPAYKITFPPHISEDIVNLYENKPNFIKSIGLRIQPLLTSAKINPNTFEEHSVPEIPSRCVRKPSIVFPLHSGKKSETNADLLKQDFHELQLHYADYQDYTDGSKDKERVGCAVLRENDHQTMHIPDGSSVFTAEAKAIDLALDLVDNCNSHDKFVIFSDSLSVLQVLNHTSSKNPQLQNILQKHHLISKYKTIVYCWIPSHNGILI